jgi:hypothetical protein
VLGDIQIPQTVPGEHLAVDPVAVHVGALRDQAAGENPDDEDGEPRTLKAKVLFDIRKSWTSHHCASSYVDAGRFATLSALDQTPES